MNVGNDYCIAKYVRKVREKGTTKKEARAAVRWRPRPRLQQMDELRQARRRVAILTRSERHQT